jgi:hypothetical protein
MLYNYPACMLICDANPSPKMDKCVFFMVSNEKMACGMASYMARLHAYVFAFHYKHIQIHNNIKSNFGQMLVSE